jgi:hypothetical protein
MDDARKATIGELDRVQRSKELQLQGGTDLDTTYQDKPAGLERSEDYLIQSEKEEHGPLVAPPERATQDSMDPSAADPFVPGTAEAPKNFDPEMLRSEREKHMRKHLRKSDPKGENGPTYEAHQGTNFRGDGGSTDPNSDLTEDTSGLQEE